MDYAAYRKLKQDIQHLESCEDCLGYLGREDWERLRSLLKEFDSIPVELVKQFEELREVQHG